MKKPKRKDLVLLGCLKEGLERGQNQLWWLGQSGFLWVQQGRAILFDPYLSDSLTRKYDGTDKPHVRITERVVAPEVLAEMGAIFAVTSSHNHTDHLDAETLLPLLADKSEPRLVIPRANRGFVLERLGPGVEPLLVEVDAGESVEVRGVQFHGIPAAHNTVERDGLGRCKFLGYVASWNGFSVYHSGDTLWHVELTEALNKFRIDVALLPINGNVPERRVAGNLDGVEAARLAKAVGARVVVPCHYDLFEFNTASPAAFEAECQRISQRYVVLQNGCGLDLTTGLPI